MGKAFEHLQTEARIDNFLAGTSKVPKGEEEQIRKAALGPRARVLQ